MKRILLILIIILNITILTAGGVGTTGANYLKIGLGAKATAMGENFTALADDTSAVYWNAAGLSKAKTSQVDFMQLTWVAGISAKSFMGVCPISDTDFIGGYLMYLDTPQDKETRYTSDGKLAYEDTGNKFKSEVSVLNVVYSKKVSAALSAGLGIKAINEQLAGVKANGYAIDAGLLYNDILPGITAGLAVQNLAINKLRQDEELPMTVALGAAYTTTLWRNRLNVLTDLKLPNDNDARYGAGLEYWLADMFAARVGYNTFNKFSLGIGVDVANLVADYAYVPLGDLGITHRFSVGYKFDTVLRSNAAVEEETQEELNKPATPETVDNLFEPTSQPTTVPATPAPQ
jgi:long-subunit fatty acid transport protein